MKKLILGLAVAALAAPIHLVSGCGSDVSDDQPPVDGDAGPEGGALGSGTGGAAAVGEACVDSLDCGSRNCDGTTKTCVPSLTNCAAPAAACTANTDCCSGSCIGLKCTAKQCTADNGACAADGECCGGKCTGAKCVPLSATCKTAGNPCAANGDCCSKYCKDKFCAASPSFCVQNGDACANATDCCGGTCTKAAGATLGLCGTVDASGAGGCTPAGQVCGAGTTGGTLPTCGGECCSRSCRPFAASGVLICQPPSGCHPTGELCRADNDCCGAPGMPGSTNSSGGGQTTDVHCNKPAGATLGRCDQGNACSPAGSICRLSTNSCNATDRCCSGTVQTHPLNCKQDALGIPRCTAAGDYDCAKSGPPPAGTACASGADCCGHPCVPNPSGSPPFVCSALACIATGGACTTTADCCAGSPCVLQPGSSKGTCGASRVGTTDAGTTSGGSSGGTTTPPAPGSTACAQYGQVCTQTSECCDAVPCTFGHCEYPDSVK